MNLSLLASSYKKEKVSMGGGISNPMLGQHTYHKFTIFKFLQKRKVSLDTVNIAKQQSTLG